jgi:uncharacterized membrane protein YsdA (DUF1294 family)
MAAPRRQPRSKPGADANRRYPRLKALVLLAVCALPVGGAAIRAFQGSWLAAALYASMSLLAVFLYWRDKRQARAGGWRTPEKVLHGVELLGGWPGALVAQQVFRHKTRKLSFQWVFWLIVLLHQLFWIDRLLLKGSYLVLQL